MIPSFYVTGGTLAVDTPSYVPRDADAQLFEALLQGDYCYVLTSRQMGKSSLMVRTAAQLRASGVTVAVIDLTAIGVNVTPGQWYDGLLLRLGHQLDLEDEVESFLDEQRELSPLQRWLLAIESVVLAKIDGPIVIFIDEIDLVRSLPFSADEFFAGLRQLYNRRGDEPAWQRVACCLIGVATPSDLISDQHMTPFNIGTRIELRDFRREEANVLASGLGKSTELAASLLDRVLHWTDGHPYLTQRLCSLIASDKSVASPTDVDRVCQTSFLMPGAKDQDNNLMFVRERILRGEADVASVLDLYRMVHRGQAIDDEKSSTIESLKLSGIVKVHDGRLVTRNRIYASVFDDSWIRSNMPDAELRRQRAAFYHGLMRATSIAAIVVVLLGSACAFAFYQWLSVGEALRMSKANELIAQREHENATVAMATAQEALKRERQQRTLAEDREQEAILLRAEAQASERESEQLRELAESRQQTAEENAAIAVENYRKMLLANERLLAEKRSVEERGKLFLAFPEWLQSYSADAVAAHAASQVEAGKRMEALKTYAEFCELALSDDDGFWSRELVHIDPERLEQLDLDASVLSTRIQVDPADIVTKVLEPGIALGEQEQRKRTNRDSKPILANLYDSQARLLFEQLQGESRDEESLVRLIRIYNRAIELDDTRSHFYVGRAVARYLADASQLALIKKDLESALAQYPTRIEPPTNDETITAAHRELAMLHNGLGGIVELQTNDDATNTALLEEAGQHYLAAMRLNAKEYRYTIGFARVQRKLATQAVGAARVELLRAAETSLKQVANDAAEHARYHNELGEIHLASGDAANASREFGLAVRYGTLHDSSVNQYRYLCNQANAYCRQKATPNALREAIAAAQNAIKLNQTDSSEAYYYLGLGTWGVAQSTEDAAMKADLLDQAVTALDQALSQNAQHIGALLARCQLLFERQDEPLNEQRVAALIEDSESALALAKYPADRAKGHYVRGLGFIRRFADTSNEQHLVDSLSAFLAAAQADTAYASLVRDYFDHAAKRTWSNDELQTRAKMLVQAFEASSER